MPKFSVPCDLYKHSLTVFYDVTAASVVAYVKKRYNNNISIRSGMDNAEGMFVIEVDQSIYMWLGQKGACNPDNPDFQSQLAHECFHCVLKLLDYNNIPIELGDHEEAGACLLEHLYYQIMSKLHKAAKRKKRPHVD